MLSLYFDRIFALSLFACGSKVFRSLLLPDFCPAGKNLEGAEGM
jgi:hypothetical protein